jgi:hypothetical protein
VERTAGTFTVKTAHDSCYRMAQMRFDGQGRSTYLEWPAALTACQHLTRLTLEGWTHLPTDIGNLVSAITSAVVLLVNQLPTSVYQGQSWGHVRLAHCAQSSFRT